jgi:hypothetical protein
VADLANPTTSSGSYKHLTCSSGLARSPCYPSVIWGNPVPNSSGLVFCLQVPLLAAPMAGITAAPLRLMYTQVMGRRGCQQSKLACWSTESISGIGCAQHTTCEHKCGWPCLHCRPPHFHTVYFLVGFLAWHPWLPCLNQIPVVLLMVLLMVLPMTGWCAASRE